MNRLESTIFWTSLLLMFIGLLETLRLVQTGKELHMVPPPRFWRRCAQKGHWYRTARSHCPLDFSVLVNASDALLTRIQMLSENPLISLHFPDHDMREAFIRFVMTYEEERNCQLSPGVALDCWQQGQLWTLKRVV